MGRREGRWGGGRGDGEEGGEMGRREGRWGGGRGDGEEGGEMGRREGREDENGFHQNHSKTYVTTCGIGILTLWVRMEWRGMEQD